jgi:hypothetical protein
MHLFTGRGLWNNSNNHNTFSGFLLCPMWRQHHAVINPVYRCEQFCG